MLHAKIVGTPASALANTRSYVTHLDFGEVCAGRFANAISTQGAQTWQFADITLQPIRELALLERWR